METLIQRRVWTLRQQTALGFISSTKRRNLQIAVSTLQGDVSLGNKVPEFIWRKLVFMATKQGDPTSLRQAYTFFAKEEVPPKRYIKCGKNAIKNLDASGAIIAYENAGVPFPKKAFLKMGEQLFACSDDDNFNLTEVLSLYKHINETPPEDHLLNLLAKCKAKYYTGTCVRIYEVLQEPVPREFIKQCFDHWVAEFDPNAVSYAAELLKRKLGKRFLISLGKKAFLQNKTDEGQKFFEMACQ